MHYISSIYKEEKMKNIVFALFSIIGFCFFIFASGRTNNNIDSMEGMVLIPGGTYQMGIDKEDINDIIIMGKHVPHMDSAHAYCWFGDEIPKHTVRVDSFYIDKYEVTNKIFAEFVKKTGYRAEGNWQKYATRERMNQPVVNVTWNDANAFAKWAGKRLPTEEEWEYAAKGGKYYKWFSWGNKPDSSKANYRYKGESIIDGIRKILKLRKMGTTPVGSYPPNGFGLFDMCGNVSEWCSNDRFPYDNSKENKSFYKHYGCFEKDGKAIYGKTVRGGNWESPNPVFVRISNRRGFNPHYSSTWLGFRCAKSLK